MDKHSPTPWRVSHGYIVLDADGVSIANAWRDADAALIVEAVNERAHLLNVLSEEQEHGYLLEEERDRLRDLVRRLEDTLQSIIDAAEGRGVGRLDEGLVREAREALEEEQ